MFHLRLKELREKRDMTQQQLAEKLNITRSSLSLYEIGKRQPDYELLKSIATFFDVSVDYLLELKETRKTSDLQTNSDLQYDSNSLLYSQIEGLSDESKNELEQFIKLLKIKDMYNDNTQEGHKKSNC